MTVSHQNFIDKDGLLLLLRSQAKTKAHEDIHKRDGLPLAEYVSFQA